MNFLSSPEWIFSSKNIQKIKKKKEKKLDRAIYYSYSVKTSGDFYRVVSFARVHRVKRGSAGRLYFLVKRKISSYPI